MKTEIGDLFDFVIFVNFEKIGKEWKWRTWIMELTCDLERDREMEMEIGDERNRV